MDPKKGPQSSKAGKLGKSPHGAPPPATFVRVSMARMGLGKKGLAREGGLRKA